MAAIAVMYRKQKHAVAQIAQHTAPKAVTSWQELSKQHTAPKAVSSWQELSKQ
jgi:hypothetical protein